MWQRNKQPGKKQLWNSNNHLLLWSFQWILFTANEQTCWQLGVKPFSSSVWDLTGRAFIKSQFVWRLSQFSHLSCSFKIRLLNVSWIWNQQCERTKSRHFKRKVQTQRSWSGGRGGGGGGIRLVCVQKTLFSEQWRPCWKKLQSVLLRLFWLVAPGYCMLWSHPTPISWVRESLQLPQSNIPQARFQVAGQLNSSLWDSLSPWDSCLWRMKQGR